MGLYARGDSSGAMPLPAMVHNSARLPSQSPLALKGYPSETQQARPAYPSASTSTLSFSTTASSSASPPPLVKGTGRPLPSPKAVGSIHTVSPTDPSDPYTSSYESFRQHAPHSYQAPHTSSLGRSDTMSSVKSLDRTGFTTSRRPLLRTPVAVNSSKSLDRGMASGVEPLRCYSRKQPSIVAEEDEEDLVSSAEPSSPSLPPLASIIPSTNPTSDQRSLPKPFRPSAFNIPSIVSPEQSLPPAKFMPLPTFNLPDEESEGDVAGGAPGIEVSGIPTIRVSSEEHTPNQKSTLPAAAIQCAECTQPIIGRIVNAMNSRFHPQCFTCNECGCLLEHVSSYEWEGKAYCHLDYHDVSSLLSLANAKKFAHHCFYCKTAIVDDRFITLNDPILGGRYYHELHFFCSECGDPFLDPSKSSAPGTKISEQDDEGETNPFVIQKGHPYCERCHVRLHKPKCKGCRQPIPDFAVDALGAKWHKECFVCSVSLLFEQPEADGQRCNMTFANDRFFPNAGEPLCIECWESSL